MESLTQTLRRDVMFYDTDCGGVVHNLAYLRMIEECRTLLGWKLGMRHINTDPDPVFAMVVRHEIDYIRPAFMGDAILVKGWVASLEKASFWCDFEMRRESDNVLLVKAHQRLALVRSSTKKPTRVPAEWASMIFHVSSNCCK